MEFKPGQRVQVKRIKSRCIGEENGYGENYPKLNWTGILLEQYHGTEWVIKWDKECDTSGDLIRTWMLEELEPMIKIIKPYGIVKFLAGERTR